MENNLIITDGVPFYSARARLQPMRGGKNLYWDVSNDNPMFLRRNGGKVYTYSDLLPQVWGDSYDFRDWKEKLHMDPGSILADPLFVDLKSRNFLLKDDSPAIAIGFKPLTGFLATGKKE